MGGSEDMILTPSDTIGTNEQIGGNPRSLVKSHNFLITVMGGSEDMILTPSDTIGTDKQFDGTESLYSGFCSNP